LGPAEEEVTQRVQPVVHADRTVGVDDGGGLAGQRVLSGKKKAKRANCIAHAELAVEVDVSASERRRGDGSGNDGEEADQSSQPERSAGRQSRGSWQISNRVGSP
jgi:hypothetical protein